MTNCIYFSMETEFQEIDHEIIVDLEKNLKICIFMILFTIEFLLLSENFIKLNILLSELHYIIFIYRT